MKLFDKIFKSNKTTEPADLTTITRTEVLEGFSIPGIIHNMQYHFTDLQQHTPAQTALQIDSLLLDRREGQLVTAVWQKWRLSASYDSFS